MSVKGYQRRIKRTNLATTFAHMRLFTSMNTLMDGQSGSLNELFPTVWKVANVRPNATVDSFYR